LIAVDVNTLQDGEPRNNFSLRASHEAFHFIAGGIGITPILSMIRYCESQGWQWRLLNLARSRECAAFHNELEAFGTDRVRFHFDDEAGHLFDFADRSFIVEPGDAGLLVKERLRGLAPHPIGSLSLRGCRVPAARQGLQAD